MARIDPVAAAGFSSAADVYERARPSYPPESVAWMAEQTGVGPGRTILDLGAGTGKLTRLLGATGARIVAVEPIPEMREKIEGAEVLDGTAEEIPLEDATADVITVAQALHWFDLDHALPEMARVLKPDGHLVLFWNMRDLEDPLQRAVEDLLAPRRAYVIAQQEGTWRAPMAETPLFGDPEVATFRIEQRFTTQDLCDRVASTSFVAAMPPVDREELLVRVRALTHGVPEPFSFPYVTEVQAFPRSRDPENFEGGTSNEG